MSSTTPPTATSPTPIVSRPDSQASQPLRAEWPSFAHISDPIEREDKELMQALEILKARYHRHARVIGGALEELEIEVAPKPEADRERVVAALESGLNTISEICQWTGLTDWKTRKVLGELILLKTVREDSPGETITKSSVGNRVRIYVLLSHLPFGVKP